MRLAAHGEPVRKFIGERIAVIEKAAGFNQESASIRPWPPSHPSNRTRSRQSRKDLDSAPNVLAFDLLWYQTIVDPAIAVTDDLMPAIHEGFGHW